MPARSCAGELSADLQRACLHQVRREYAHYNEVLFEGRLRMPGFGWLEPGSQLGEWDHAARLLRLSLGLVDRGWGALIEVLKHEMAHQYVGEVLGVREPPHGEVFRSVCLPRGIDSRAAGLPEPGDQPATSGILEKVAKLLSLAASASEHEAHSAMAAAQRLMLKHNLQGATAAKGAAYASRHLGTPSGRVFEHSRVIALIVAEHFFVEALWVPVWRPREGKSGSVVEICGTRENVELAAYVHDFLVQSGERLWIAHRRAQRLGGNRLRHDFLAGVMHGFKRQLDEQRLRCATEGLVWQGDPALGAYFKQRHPRTQWVRYGGRPITSTRLDGERAGHALVLHRGLSSPAAAATTTPLLPRPRS